MPIYEYYSPDTHRIYSFFAKTLAQAQRVPPCPDDPKARMVKLVSAFAVGGGKARREEATAVSAPDESVAGPDEARLETAMNAMEKEFASVDENDPRAMARLMRRMAEATGETLDEPMEEAVRKLEEGADPDQIEEQLGSAFGDELPGTTGDADASPAASPVKEARARLKPRRVRPPSRDPKLYDFE